MRSVSVRRACVWKERKGTQRNTNAANNNKQLNEAHVDWTMSERFVGDDLLTIDKHTLTCWFSTKNILLCTAYMKNDRAWSGLFLSHHYMIVGSALRFRAVSVPVIENKWHNRNRIGICPINKNPAKMCPSATARSRYTLAADETHRNLRSGFFMKGTERFLIRCVALRKVILFASLHTTYRENQ